MQIEFVLVGSRMLKVLLRQEGFTAGRRHGCTLMKRMASRNPTSEAEHFETGTEQQELSIPLAQASSAPAQPGVGMDITCIPMAQGFG